MWKTELRLEPYVWGDTRSSVECFFFFQLYLIMWIKMILVEIKGKWKAKENGVIIEPAISESDQSDSQ